MTRQKPSVAVPALLAVGLAFAATSTSQAFINVELRPALQSVPVGSTVSIGLYVVSDSDVNQGLSAAQVVFTWQTSKLQMLSNDNSGAVSLLMSGFPSPDPYGLNESSLPQDGNAMYVAYSRFGNPAMATSSGTLLTTLRFLALAPTPLTPVSPQVSGGTPLGFTIVFDSGSPNTSVTGTLSGAGVEIVPAPWSLAPAALAWAAIRRKRR